MWNLEEPSLTCASYPSWTPRVSTQGSSLCWEGLGHSDNEGRSLVTTLPFHWLSLGISVIWLVRAGGKIGYITLYSCQGQDAANFVSLKDRAVSCESRDMELVLSRCREADVRGRPQIGRLHCSPLIGWSMASISLLSCGARIMFIWSRAMGRDYEVSRLAE